MSQLGFLFDQRYCIGCQACQTACQVRNSSPVGVSLRRAVSFEDVPEGPFMTLSCNHCVSPACVEACPQGAISKDGTTGIVDIDRELCIGCGTCASVCPYGAPTVDEVTHVALKCDFCRDLIEAGEAPACVRACPVKVLTYGELEDLDRAGSSEAPGFSSGDTEPAIRFVTA